MIFVNYVAATGASPRPCRVRLGAAAGRGRGGGDLEIAGIIANFTPANELKLSNTINIDFFLMKRLLTLILAAAALAACVQPAAAQIKREQRGVWMSAYVTDWPSSKITASNQRSVKLACQKMLDTLANNNMNVVYYHVRAMCDAMYNSAYEPWSSYVSEQRGVAPPFDPFAYIVQEAHKRGIEVYAWVNPYRYSPKSTQWGQSDLDYVHTHPEWLMKTDYETVLNPGLPQVRQRVVDVCKDIITKYDCDGLVFDDYFYNQGGSSFDLDSALYNAYKRGGGTLSQGDWRRENVNQMVHDVNQMVKQTKPWVRFGIGPAGVCCSNPTVAAKYGVDPSPGSDWQYNTIYSDPMAWLSRGTIDFMSPQVYWNTAGNYDEVTNWWGKVGNKFNRHVYISGYAVDRITSTSLWTLDEYLKQVQVMRDAMASGNYGMIYFKYATWRNLSQTIDGKVVSLRQFLKRNAYATKTLSPVPQWLTPSRTYGTVTGLRHTGDSLVWDSIPNVRYVVYAVPDSVPDAQFRCQPQFIEQVSYSSRYAIARDHRSGHRFAVSILDRWENEYAPVMEGATARQAARPVLLNALRGDTITPLNTLRWQGEGSNFTVEVFADAALSQRVTCATSDSASCPVMAINGLSDGTTYWWRVTARGLNLTDATSEAGSFTLSNMRINSPASGSTGVALTPQFTWTRADGPAQYTLEISKASDMDPVLLTYRTSEPQFTVPRYALSGGTRYYARVTVAVGRATLQSSVASFTTADVVPAAPVWVTPAADGATLHGNDSLQVQPVEGMQSLRLEMSTSNKFPVRSSYRPTINQGFASPALSEISGVGKPVDGKTYYVRARWAYTTAATGTATQYSDYGPILSFVYKAQAVGDLNGDGTINTTDVTALVTAILAGNAGSDCDIDGDGTVNTTDVTALVSLVLKN